MFLRLLRGMSYLFGQRKITVARCIIAAILRPVKLSMLKSFPSRHLDRSRWPIHNIPSNLITTIRNLSHSEFLLQRLNTSITYRIDERGITSCFYNRSVYLIAIRIMDNFIMRDPCIAADQLFL